MEDWTTHHGLRNVIGPCSEETRTALSQAFSYLRISYITAKRSLTTSCTFALSPCDDATTTSNDQIEFDSKTESWHYTKRAQPTSDEADTSSQRHETQPARSDSARPTENALSLRSKEIREDWTSLLPATSHVEFLKSREWHKTSLGPMLEWPYTLRIMTMKMLDDPRPANLYWGSNRIAIYNEPFSIVAASRHPMMMGSTAEKTLPATYPFLSGVFAEIERSGVAFSMPEFQMSVEKVAGFVEEAWYDGTFSPIRDTDGKFLGLYNSGYDITDRKLAQRNSELIHQIATGPVVPGTTPWQHIINVCADYDKDIPFLVVYSSDHQDDPRSGRFVSRYEGSLGIEKGHPALSELFDIHEGNDGFMPVLRAAKVKEELVPLEMPGGKLPDFLQDGVEWRGHGVPCTNIVASPLHVTGTIAGFLIIGLNPRRRYDETHKNYIGDIVRVSNYLLAYSNSAEQARKREEKLTNELSQSQKSLQRIAETATVGMSTYSVDGLMTWGNHKFFETLGTTQKPEERYNYRNLYDLLDGDQEKGKEGFLRCLKMESVHNLQLRLKKTWRPPGSEHDEPCWVMISMTPNVEDGKVVDVLCCATDVSHLKWAENLQMRSAQAAKHAKEQQERFIDVSSHEMRNPLGAILQCADDITTMSQKHQTATTANGQCTEVFQTIEENAKNILFCAAHQKRIIDDILTVSKLDSFMLTVTPVPVNLETMTTQVTQAFAAQMAEEGIHFSFKLQSGYTDLGITFTYCDPSRVTQILINLITNAIKFTKFSKRKEICVRVNALTKRPPPHNPTCEMQWFPSSAQSVKLAKSSSSEASGDVIYIVFEVEDSGAGISKDEMALLFNRFAQATPKTHVTYGGSGLGLFISRQLAELQGGMIGVSSQPDAGSTFTFYFETRRATEAECTEAHLQQNTSYKHGNDAVKGKVMNGTSKSRGTPQQTSLPSTVSARPEPQKPPSILFVEDNLINQKVLGKQLERLGCKVYIANHGVEALSLIKNSVHWTGNKADSPRIDVVLMDWEMPVMDGLTCTQRIRELEANGSMTQHIPVIGATANARAEQVETAMSAGMDDLITKPFTVKALMKRIEDLILQ